MREARHASRPSWVLSRGAPTHVLGLITERAHAPRGAKPAEV